MFHLLWNINIITRRTFKRSEWNKNYVSFEIQHSRLIDIIDEVIMSGKVLKFLK